MTNNWPSCTCYKDSNGARKCAVHTGINPVSTQNNLLPEDYINSFFEPYDGPRSENLQAAPSPSPSVELPVLTTFKSGAKSTVKMPDFSKCPLEALEAIVGRFDYGEANSGYDWSWQHSEAGTLFRGNFKKGADDAEFVRDRFNHLARHLFRLASGIGTYLDLEAIMCNGAMLCWLRKNGTGFGEAFPNAAYTPEQTEGK